MERNQKILAMRGKKSFALIAKELGISRNVVAGVCFRADHPGYSPKSYQLYGRRRGPAAPHTLWTSRA